MRRRQFIAGLGSAAAWPMVAWAQQPAVPTIGWLYFLSPDARQYLMPAFHQGLAETGYVEGRNVAITHRWADGHADRQPVLAADLVRRQVAVIVTDTTISAVDAKAATQTIPIVFFAGGDPVEFGLVASLNRPGGNVTGVTVLGPDITTKRLELLHKLVPSARSIAMLVSTYSQYAESDTRNLQSAARVLGLRVLVINGQIENEIAPAFAMLVEQQADAILMGSHVFSESVRDQIISLAAHHAIPTMFFNPNDVPAGGLVSYGSDLVDAFHQVGVYTARILKGEKAADLPVVQSTRFNLGINLKTARTLGLEISPLATGACRCSDRLADGVERQNETSYINDGYRDRFDVFGFLECSSSRCRWQRLCRSCHCGPWNRSSLFRSTSSEMWS
jgi:putative ABC transport system substrate-binding protein